MQVFETLNGVNVNGHTEKKKTGNAELTYLSWPWAWSEVKSRYPDAHYEIWKDPQTGRPYTFDPETGYMVYTSVTIDGITHEMWLPVMDGANKAMKNVPYEYTIGYGDRQKTKYCEAATMFDVNKTIMRCLVKNLAMFGLGLYIYAGEDLPEGEKEEDKPTGITCSDCGQPIRGVKVGGEEWPPLRISMQTTQTYGRPLCYDCSKKAKALSAKGPEDV